MDTLLPVHIETPIITQQNINLNNNSFQAADLDDKRAPSIKVVDLGDNNKLSKKKSVSSDLVLNETIKDSSEEEEKLKK